MARPLRLDPLNGWQHLMNQGVGKRSIFESIHDARMFQAKMAQAVRRGDIEVHSFCIMPNHYHALIRSLRGRMSAAIQRIQDGYARYFNRSRNRVGHVFRGRFRSELVTSADYWHTLVWYIDQNPVLDGLITHPAEYPWGSASYYAEPRGPIWLSRDLVQRLHYDREETLARLLSPTRRDRILRFLDQRMATKRVEKDPLDFLLHGSSEQVRKWISNRALNADGIRAGIPVVTTKTVIDAATRGMVGAEISLDNQILGAWALVTACGATCQEAAAALAISKTTAHTRLRQFRERTERDPEWLLRAEVFLRECLRLDHPFAQLAELSQTQLF
ncbi:MAG: transposase [Planctomycetota bacterium]